MSRTWLPPLGAAAGFALGLADLGLLRTLGVTMVADGRDVSMIVMVLYAATFAALGAAIATIAVARGQAQRDAQTIGSQLDALRRSSDRLLQVEKLASIGRMSAGIAHEVRNPLGVIRSSAALIAESLPDRAASSRRACDFIVEEVDRLNRFVTRILDFARPLSAETGAVLLDATIARAAALAADRLAAVDVQIPHPLGAISGDADLMVQLFTGLLVNAGEAGARCVALEIEHEAGQVHIDVGDDGPGVALEDEDRLFEPFFSRKPTGTGLGLPMAQRIAQAHGGTMTHRRHPRMGGACFRVTLPVQA